MKNPYRRVRSNGYYALFIPEHPCAFGRGYVYEHRFLMEQMLNRNLSKTEIVHHKDGNKLNNELSNLELLPSIAYHKLKHRIVGFFRKLPDEENTVVECSCGCGVKFNKFDRNGRPRLFYVGHNYKNIDSKKNRIDIIECGCGCGEKINKYDKHGRVRVFISGHNGRKKQNV